MALRGNSIVSDLYRVYQTTKKTCLLCNERTICNFDNEMIIKVNFTDAKSFNTSLDALLKFNFAETTMKGTNAIECDKCKKKTH